MVRFAVISVLLGPPAPEEAVSPPPVRVEKSSLKTVVAFPPPPPLEVMEICSVALPVPVAFVAESVALVVPAVVGVPEMRPVAVFTESPVGRLAAANDVGEFEAVI